MKLMIVILGYFCIVPEYQFRGQQICRDLKFMGLQRSSKKWTIVLYSIRLPAWLFVLEYISVSLVSPVYLVLLIL